MPVEARRFPGLEPERGCARGGRKLCFSGKQGACPRENAGVTGGRAPSLLGWGPGDRLVRLLLLVEVWHYCLLLLFEQEHLVP